MRNKTHSWPFVYGQTWLRFLNKYEEEARSASLDSLHQCMKHTWHSELETLPRTLHLNKCFQLQGKKWNPHVCGEDRFWTDRFRSRLSYLQPEPVVVSQTGWEVQVQHTTPVMHQWARGHAPFSDGGKEKIVLSLTLICFIGNDWWEANVPLCGSDILDPKCNPVV